LEDGRVIFPDTSLGLPAFEGLFHCSDSTLEATSVKSQVPEVNLFDVTAPAPPTANGSNIIVLGSPVALERYYALVSPISGIQ